MPAKTARTKPNKTTAQEWGAIRITPDVFTAAMNHIQASSGTLVPTVDLALDACNAAVGWLSARGQALDNGTYFPADPVKLKRHLVVDFAPFGLEIATICKTVFHYKLQIDVMPLRTWEYLVDARARRDFYARIQMIKDRLLQVEALGAAAQPEDDSLAAQVATAAPRRTPDQSKAPVDRVSLEKETGIAEDGWDATTGKLVFYGQRYPYPTDRQKTIITILVRDFLNGGDGVETRALGTAVDAHANWSPREAFRKAGKRTGQIKGFKVLQYHRQGGSHLWRLARPN